MTSQLLLYNKRGPVGGEPPAEEDVWLLEDDSGNWLLEDSSGYWLME